MPSRPSLLDLSHRLDLPMEEWWSMTFDGLQAIAPNVPLLGFGGGRVLPAVDLRAKRLRDESRLSAVMSALRELDRESNGFLLDQGPLFRWSDVIRSASSRLRADRVDLLRAVHRSLSDRDLVCGTCLDPRGVGLFVDYEVGFDAPSPVDENALGAALAHTAAALRLRLELETGRPSIEAVVSADGARVEHASGEALSSESRETLRAAVRHMDRTRASDALTPLDRLFAQEVMVSGRWSLMDEFESDGKHYVFARVNAPTLEQRLFPQLSTTEEQVLLYAALGHTAKYIGYELGLSRPSISRTLHSARTRLGVASLPAAIEEVRRRLGAWIEAGAGVSETG